ncbi:MAG: TatD family hydrolase [Clostridium sp.]|nr:TatD family hydrolase [Clostridium sp.]MCM1443788.1 TatD family hydrolase [Candidatus Amulumruptor caecigallinarius]
MRIDTHCHLDSKDYDDLKQVINHMGNNIIIASGVDNNTNLETINLCLNYPNIYGTIGIHPEYSCLDSDQICNALIKIEENIKNPKIVGIGEIGLDYHYPNIDKEAQKSLFIKQLELARKYNKTVVIHSRDAALDTYEILKDYNDLKKVVHCYSYSIEMAYKFIDINCMLGIGGVVTFKNSSKLKEVVRNIPIEYLLLETDSPYLSPEPLRGLRNEPYNTIYVAEEISKLKCISLDNVLKSTTINACSQFDLKITI